MLTFSDLSMELLNEVLYFDIFDAITIFSAVISLLLSIVFNKSNLTTLSTLTYSIISIAVTLTHLGEPADDLYFGRLLFLILVIFLVFFTVSTDYYVEKKVLGEEANWAGSFFVMFIQQLVVEENFISFFICLESASFCIFLLMGSYIREKSIEATIKYLILSSIGTSVILLSILLLYFYSGTFVMSEIAFDICFESDVEYSDYIVILLILGLTSKLSIYPSNTIAADVSEAALSHVFLIINILLKFTAFIIVLEIQDWINHDLEMLNLINIVSYIYGSLTALIETQIIRFLALGATNQFGFLMMCSSIESELLITLLLLQLLIYFAAIYRMLVVIEILQRFVNVTNITDLYYVNSNSFLKWYLVTIIYDLAGFPPFNVFFTKFILLYFIFTFSSLFIFLCLLIINCIYYFYYLRLLKNIIYNKDYDYIYIELDRDEMLNLEFEQNLIYFIIYIFIFLI
jgi:NADH-quinone oxidoreductase subunit N